MTRPTERFTAREALAHLLFHYQYGPTGHLPFPGTKRVDDWGPHNDPINHTRADEVLDLLKAHGWRPPLTDEEQTP